MKAALRQAWAYIQTDAAAMYAVGFICGAGFIAVCCDLVCRP